jgi:hypothetical protein
METGLRLRNMGVSVFVWLLRVSEDEIAAQGRRM